MALRIYNTLGRSKETFTPQVPGKVSLYVCGVTTYNHSHIGHGRAMVVFDVVARYLRSLGLEVKFARNYTDIDDKIIVRAHKEGEDPFALSQRYVEAAQADLLSLGCRAPDVEPRVTTHIPQIVQFVEGLIAAGKAYPAANGDVYYSVESFEGYGKLSGKKVDELLAGARVDVIEEKRSPADFALWKAAKPGEPSWESPWGPGRPGWHIECSAMACEHLGQTIDIHGGGSDLIFPHHENEIAQSEGLTGAPLARYWMHNAMLTVGHEKMSKSLNNFFTITDILVRYHAEAVRMFYLSSHYRSPVDYSDRSLAESEAGLERLYQALSQAQRWAGAEVLEPLTSLTPDVAGFQALAQLGRSATEQAGAGAVSSPAEKDLLSLCKELPGRVRDAMDDDFNTAQALGVLFELSRAMGRYSASHPRGTPAGKALLTAAGLLLAGTARLYLGVLTESPAAFQADLNRRRLAERKLAREEVERLVAARNQARAEKSWAEADRLRAELAGLGITLEDSPSGTLWRVEAQVGAPPQV